MAAVVAVKIISVRHLWCRVCSETVKRSLIGFTSRRSRLNQNVFSVGAQKSTGNLRLLRGASGPQQPVEIAGLNLQAVPAECVQAFRCNSEEL